MLKKLSFVAGFVLIAVIAWIGYQFWVTDARVAEARGFATDEQWREARHQLRQVLRWRPTHPQANLLMAEALIRDDLLTAPGDEQAGLKVVDEALEHLARIPENSPYSAKAHVQTGRLEALVRLHPQNGLRHLRRAVELDPENDEAYYLIWKVNELIGRPHLVVDEIWQAIELAPADRRPILLREWYMGEFFATTANIALERQMGLLAPGQEPDNQTTAERYLVFATEEPTSTFGQVALARWFLNQGAREDCLLHLDAAINTADQPFEDPLLVSTLIQVLGDLGKFDEAAKYFEQWPGEKDGYDYWRAKGLVDQRAKHDLPAAIDAYRKAIDFWPGQVDWRTWNLLANCMRENGDAEAAAKVAERSNEIERLMRVDVQSTLRYNLGFLDRPAGLKDIVRFYRDLELNREADAWQAIVDSLESKDSSGA